jgi:site-specific DNA recombinase
MSKPRVRCAIYTRKSSEDGLDQDFNSLDAQHEACAAYITSQRHEGWRMLPTRYDDGGISGGTLARPALQSLLADIDAGRVDMVVVYKIDRLTRSLPDFVRTVDRLDAADCSFVSVTQAFNTSSSMGRLTLNMLLSFAQFEREVTSERIRDKIAASKKKGLWMGGVPPIGYDPHPDLNRRELVVNEPEASVVRQIYNLYATHKCLAVVTRKTVNMGLLSKRHVFSTGRVQGGNVFSRGHIHKLLTNPIYLGLIRHKEKTFPGLHSAIIDQDVWDNVQTFLQAASARHRGAPAGSQSIGSALLKGKFRDDTGDLLTPTHTICRGKRLRYYVSNRLISGGTDPAGWRLPASAFEVAIAKAVAGHLAHHAKRHAVLVATDATASIAASKAIANLALRITSKGAPVAARLITSGKIGDGRLKLSLDRAALAEASTLSASDLNEALLSLDLPFTCRRRGVEIKIIAGDRSPAPDEIMIRGLRNAHRWSNALKSGTPLRQLAKTAKYSERYIARIIPLAGLSPKIQAAIIDGSQPIDLVLEKLARATLPLDWSEQERMLGFGA